MKRIISILITCALFANAVCGLSCLAYVDDIMDPSSIIGTEDGVVKEKVTFYVEGQEIEYTIESYLEANQKHIAVSFLNDFIEYIIDYEKDESYVCYGKDTKNYKKIDSKLLKTRSSNEIVSGSDKWFGYSYYRNDASAYLDYYWRLDNPYRNPVRKNFFSAYNDNNNYYANKFKTSINLMRNYQNNAEAHLILASGLALAGTIAGIIAAMSNPTGTLIMAAITATLTGANESLDAAESYYYAFMERYNADYYFDMVS